MDDYNLVYSRSPEYESAFREFRTQMNETRELHTKLEKQFRGRPGRPDAKAHLSQETFWVDEWDRGQRSHTNECVWWTSYDKPRGCTCGFVPNDVTQNGFFRRIGKGVYELTDVGKKKAQAYEAKL